jgi:hypothetical protein
MKISASCFKDDEIRNTINSSGNAGLCEVTNQKGIVVDIEYFSDFFSDLLNIFQESPTSKKSLIQLIQEDWDFFHDENIAKIILSECIKLYRPNFNSTQVEYNTQILDFIKLWEKIKDILQHQTRYFTNLEKLCPFDPMLERYIVADEPIARGHTFYRARVLPDKKAYYQKKDMGCPPPEKVNAGRANPIGIPYLYLCADKETTYYEVRARFLDRICIGTFKTNRDLNIVNFADKVSLFLSSHSGNIIEFIKKKLLLNGISKDMSKPLTRYDSELEYVPTQYICELSKLHGADGICFESSLKKGGLNYVLFNENDADCIDVENIHIKEVIIKA